MNLVDLKIPKKTKKELKEGMMPSTKIDQPEQYPYGMRLSLNTEQMPKFPQLEKASVGDMVGIQGIGEVMEVRKVDRQGDNNQFTVEIQIQKIGLKVSPETKADTLIGAIEKGKKGLLK